MPKIPEDILDQARHTDLAEYLKTHGYDLKKEGKSYRVSGYSGGLIVTGYKWSWKTQGIGGKSVDFLVKVLGMTLPQAVQELISSNIPYLPDEPPPLPEPTVSGNFQLPERADNEKRVIAYLCKRRQIQYDIVIKLIKTGKLYQDTSGNCVFIITDWDGKAVGTESHGTGTTRFKNSTKHTGYGFRLLCGSQPTGAMFFESAIDLLSYYQIFRKSLTHHYLISTAGTGNDRTIQVFHQQRPDLKICLCCDNDQAGENLIQKVRHEIDNGVFVHRPKYREDWNEVLCYGDIQHQ
ncbi:MAG: DUF3991 and TOPRIM domain-containing protein [Lachnospiraceae bacterium]|nr:DUF3991 and TOPRIM domain-containing protein [Lachnospiraceae bacterium]